MKQAFLTVDLGFGDAGKGSIVDFLTRQHGAHTVVRYNGGSQAGHRVVSPGDVKLEHVFSQFGSGTLAGAATHLSRFMLLEPLAMLAEAEHLQTLTGSDPFRRTTIDEGALVTTPFHRAVNRLREVARGAGRHGSCGMGIGETMVDYLAHGDQVLFAADLQAPDVLRQKLRFLQRANRQKLCDLGAPIPDNEQVAAELAVLHDDEAIDWLMAIYADFCGRADIVKPHFLHTLLNRPGTVIFEGAQGVLLDEWWGFHPHTTWSTTTLQNADMLLAEAGYDGAVTRLGLTRAYATRHGAGPFVSEDAAMTTALPDARNGVDDWQGGFRVGPLDLVMLRYAVDVVGSLDALAVTCIDRLAEVDALRVCDRYQVDTFVTDRIALSPLPQDLAYQARITEGLRRCTPLYRAVDGVAGLLDVIEAACGVRVGVVSEGVSAEAKSVLTPMMSQIDNPRRA